MTVGSRQDFANAEFRIYCSIIDLLNINLLLSYWDVHIDEMLTQDNHIKHISSKVSNGLRILYLARKLTDNQEILKTI